jgi:hypothetical protein
MSEYSSLFNSYKDVRDETETNNSYLRMTKNFKQSGDLASFQKQKEEMKVALSGVPCYEYDVVPVDKIVVELNRPSRRFDFNTCVVRPTTEIIYQGIKNQIPKEQIQQHFTIAFVPAEQLYQEYKDDKTSVVLLENDMKFYSRYGRECDGETQLIAPIVTKVEGRTIVLVVELASIMKLASDLKTRWNEKYYSCLPDNSIKN